MLVSLKGVGVAVVLPEWAESGSSFGGAGPKQEESGTQMGVISIAGDREMVQGG